ncbi:MAG TPA: prolipoprotein diacylglyceryl transferase [Saprospiraceae bacterium]|nr:prolipoprotein diacylglyceryl transferase [Saprospiraceae bacterium]
MYPDLSYFLHDIFGTSPDNWASIIKTFGFFLALAFLGSGWVLRSELKRYENEGKLSSVKKKVQVKEGFNLQELLINGLLLFIAGGKVPYIINHFDEMKADPASVIFSSSGIWIIGIVTAAAYIIYYFLTQKGKKATTKVQQVTIHPYEKTGDIVIVAAISGIVGARLFSIFENFDAFIRDPVGNIFSGSGLTIYGGLILAFVVVYWYIKKWGIKPIHMMDISGMAILVGYAIGRLGCQFSGDGDWGIMAAAQPEWWFLPDWLWGYDYPNNVTNTDVLLEHCDSVKFSELRQQGIRNIEILCEQSCGIRYCHRLSAPVYPTPVYETLLSFAGFGILWILRKRIHIAGMLFFMYMVYNGIERFFIEEIRVNERYDFAGLYWSQAQYISALFAITGIAGIFYLWHTNKKKTKN